MALAPRRMLREAQRASDDRCGRGDDSHPRRYGHVICCGIYSLPRVRTHLERSRWGRDYP